jgi:hypothetical protein
MLDACIRGSSNPWKSTITRRLRARILLALVFMERVTGFAELTPAPPSRSLSLILIAII